jgi:hypothetical protein
LRIASGVDCVAAGSRRSGVVVQPLQLAVVLGGDEGPQLAPVVAREGVQRAVVGAVVDLDAAAGAEVHGQRARVRDVAVDGGARLDDVGVAVFVEDVLPPGEVDSAVFSVAVASRSAPW